MTEGWLNDQYVVLFEKDEIPRITAAYAFDQYLPGYSAAGLLFWDDFIVQNKEQKLFIVPNVPLRIENLRPFDTAIHQSELVTDPRFTNKIRWFVKPIVFGGDPTAKENTTWITIQQHTECVKWWNVKYRELAPK